MINSVFNEGARGVQNSQREMLKSAQEIANLNVTENPEARQNPDQARTVAPVEQTERSDSGDIAEPLIELRRQEQLFNASAQIVSVADEALGSLIDVKS